MHLSLLSEIGLFHPGIVHQPGGVALNADVFPRDSTWYLHAIQISHLDGMKMGGSLTALALILVAGICYPLGNRKMMTVCPPELTTVQRVFGMTLCSTPFWSLCSVYAAVVHGVPSAGQLFQSLSVAVFSGVIATLLFFEATNLVKHNPKQLAVVEATQAGEVLFTLLGGIAFLHDALPTPSGILGICVVVIGMILNSLAD